MKQTRKIRLVFEAEVQQDTELTPEVVARVLSGYSNYSPTMVEDNGWQESIRHNQVMLTALLDNPALYHRYLLDKLLGSIEGGLYSNEILRLAGEKPKDEPLLQVLDSVPPDTNIHFQEIIDEGLFSENTEFAYYSLQTNFTKVYIEDIESLPSKVE